MPARTPPPAVIDAALTLRRALHRAADALLPPGVVAWELSMGIERTHVIGALAELQVAEALAGGPRTAADVAGELGVKPTRCTAYSGRPPWTDSSAWTAGAASA